MLNSMNKKMNNFIKTKILNSMNKKNNFIKKYRQKYAKFHKRKMLHYIKKC